MITDRGVSVLILLVACLALFWIFSVTRKESELSPRTIAWIRKFGFCLVGLACVPLIQSFILKPPSVSQLFQSTDCRIACWNDLVPGQTNLDTLRAFLRAKPNSFEESDTHKLTGKEDTKSFDTQTTDGMQIHVDTTGDFISQIRLTASAFSLSLSDVIRQFGNSDYAAIYYFMVHNDKTDILDSQIVFFYPDKGYVFSTSSPSNLSEPNVETCISGNELINDIRVVPVGTIDQIFSQLDRPPGKNMIFSKDRWRSYLINALKPLSNYGCYKMPYSPLSDLFMQTW
jgi:hypothetical protein